MFELDFVGVNLNGVPILAKAAEPDPDHIHIEGDVKLEMQSIDREGRYVKIPL